MNTNISLGQKTPYILIVDDAPMNLLVLSEILNRTGYETRSVTDGMTALKVSEEEKPDLILLDIMMPGMDGYEVCRRLKEDKNLSDIPVIFISALNDSQTIVKAFQFGGIDYITKPFQIEEVTARVNTHLKLYHQSKQLQELNANLLDSQNQLKKFASHLQFIREEERILLGTEIHDKIGQILVALKIDMGIWKKKVFTKLKNSISPEILDNFNELVSIVDNTISTARKITSELKSDNLEILGFIEAAKLYCEEFKETNNIDCQFESSLTKLEINEQQNVALFRIMQDALLNVTNHGNVTIIKVSISLFNNDLIMEIVDNGLVINEDRNIGPNAYGILNMNERVLLLDGKLSIKCEAGKENIIRVEIPYLI
ncbi:MAG: response regulator [Paludibacter sp.]